jgi:hypothetical protein
MAELKPGDRIKDNDPRMDRVLSVARVSAEYVYANWAGRESRIRKDRIYTDGKPRRSGFSVISVVMPAQATLDSPSIDMPPGLTDDEKRAFILGVAAAGVAPSDKGVTEGGN